MHPKLGLLLTLGLLASTAVSAQVTVTDTHEGGKPVPKPAPFNMKSAENVSRQTLANQNIIQMVKSGTQETTILAAIRSRRSSFDLSPKGCSALRQANVSQNIMNAMGGGKSPCNSMLPNPVAGQNQQTITGGTLLGNRNTTLLGNSGAQTTSTPSNGGDPASLNPQPLPPRTGTLLQNTTPANATPTAGTTQRTTLMTAQPAGAASIAPAQSNAPKGAPGTAGTSPAPPQ